MNTIRTYKIKEPFPFFYEAVIALLTLPHLKTEYFEVLPEIDFIFNISRIISFFIILFLYVMKGRINELVLTFLFMEVFLLINTIVHDGDIYSCMISCFSTISIVLLYDMGSKASVSFIRGQMFLFEIFIYINLLTVIIYPDGLYQAYYIRNNWFLGYYNVQDKYFLLALIFAFIYKKQTGKAFRCNLLLGAVVTTVFITKSAGIMIQICLIVIAYFFRKKTRLFNYCSYCLLQLSYFIMIIILQQHHILGWILNDILHKWKSLEGRMYVWEKALKNFLESPIWGYGIEPSITRKASYGWAFHAHNFLLEVLHQGGIIYLVFLLVIIILAGKKIMKLRNTEVAQIISLGILGWSVHGTVEPMIGALYMGIFVLAYHSDDFVNSICKENRYDKKFTISYRR